MVFLPNCLDWFESRRIVNDRFLTQNETRKRSHRVVTWYLCRHYNLKVTFWYLFLKLRYLFSDVESWNLSGCIVFLVLINIFNLRSCVSARPARIASLVDIMTRKTALGKVLSLSSALLVH